MARRKVTIEEEQEPKAPAKKQPSNKGKAGKAKAEAEPLSELESVRQAIIKERGAGKFHSGDKHPHINYIPTGVFLLDLALLGGIPDGRASLVYGVESSGKSNLLYLTMGQFQKKYPNQTAVLGDVEHMLEGPWAEKLGVVLSRMELVDPDHGQEAVDLVLAYMAAEEVGFAAIDSLASLVPMQLDDRSVEDYGMGERAKIIGDYCSKVLNLWTRESRRGHSITVFNVNQYRDKMNASKFEDPRRLPGGWQSNYFPRVKIQMKMRKIIPKGATQADHNLHTFRIDKEKGGTLSSGEFRMNLNPDHPKGLPIGTVDDYDTVIAYAKREGIVHGGGASWKLRGIEEPFRTLDNMEDFLIGNPEEFIRVKQRLILRTRIRVGLDPLPKDKYLLAPCSQRLVNEEMETL